MMLADYFITEGAAYCERHAPEDAEPVTFGEPDRWITCEVCHAPLAPPYYAEDADVTAKVIADDELAELADVEAGGRDLFGQVRPDVWRWRLAPDAVAEVEGAVRRYGEREAFLGLVAAYLRDATVRPWDGPPPCGLPLAARLDAESGILTAEWPHRSEG